MFDHCSTGTRRHDDILLTLEQFYKFSCNDLRLVMVTPIVGWLAAACLTHWKFNFDAQTPKQIYSGHTNLRIKSVNHTSDEKCCSYSSGAIPDPWSDHNGTVAEAPECCLDTSVTNNHVKLENSLICYWIRSKSNVIAFFANIFWNQSESHQKSKNKTTSTKPGHEFKGRKNTENC